MDMPTLKSGYSYSLLKEVLAQKYSVVTVDDRKKLKEKLQYSQVALLVTPTVPLTDQETEVIKGFVAQGGRLIVIADHTDLYGHGRVINAFSKEFGIRVEYNALFYPNNYYAQINLQNTLYSFRPKTPCSLMLTKPGGYVFGWAKSWISEMADYTKPNFFGELQWTSDDIEGDWPVGIIKKYGKGEVVVWADSTVFANFCIFQPNTLRFLGCLIEGGKLLAYCSQYGFYLLLLSIISLCFKKITRSNFFFVILLVVIFSSGCYYFWDFNPELFYPKNKRIDFYGNKELFDEPSPKTLPLDGHISSAYSNVARCGLYPLYVAEKPSKPVSYKSIWATSWDKIEKVDKKTLQSLWGIVVIDVDDELENIGFKKITFEENINKCLIDVFPKVFPSREMLVAGNNVHTLTYSGTSVFAAEGVITDKYIGDWWITTNISPYRNFILEEWINWLNKKNDIQKFFYPPSGITDGGDEWLIRAEGKDFLKRKMKVIPYKNDMRFVYIGSGIWASYEQVSNEVFLLGGPETSDNLLRSGYIRWAARKY
jgi:hypothetical protein